MLRRGVEEEKIVREDGLYVWLFVHSLEQFYPVIQRFGVSSVEQMLALTSSDVASEGGNREREM